MARIALIDDDRDFTTLVAELLEEQGWSVVICHDDTSGVQCIREEHPDLVILDVRMSSRDSGWQILEQLQRDAGTHSVPAIVCSAAIDDLTARADWMEERGIAALRKPFDIDDLLRLIESMLPPDPPENSSTHIGSNGGTQSG